MFLIEYGKLVAGDIILTGGKSIAGVLVKVFTFSRFSHAMIWVDGTLIHSDGGGVYSQNPQRMLFTSRSQVKVLRLKKRLSPRKKGIINNYARTQILSVYSTFEAAAVVIPWKIPMSERQFCSRLVAQCYEKAGIKIVKDANYCTPANFDNPQLFDEVHDAVREATQADIDFTKTRDVNSETQKDTVKMITEIRKVYGKNIQTLRHVVDLVLKNPEADAVVTDIALRSGYFDHGEVDMEVNPWRYNEHEFREHAQKHNLPVLELGAFIRVIGESSAAVHLNELKTNKRYFELSGGRFFHQQIILYKKLINTEYIRRDLVRKIAKDHYGFVPEIYS